MADIVDFGDFKKRKLGDAVAEWEQYMSRAEQFQREGKDKFAAQMLDKAKEVRKVIDKLRGPVRAVPFLKFGNHDAMLNVVPTVTVEGRATADYGYPKSSPETTPTTRA